jgi:hypothetical protein
VTMWRVCTEQGPRTAEHRRGVRRRKAAYYSAKRKRRKNEKIEKRVQIQEVGRLAPPPRPSLAPPSHLRRLHQQVHIRPVIAAALQEGARLEEGHGDGDLRQVHALLENVGPDRFDPLPAGRALPLDLVQLLCML